jgi:hypothetical protein
MLRHGMHHHFTYPRVEEIVRPRPRTVTSLPSGPLTQRQLVLASLLRRSDAAPRNGGR